MLNSRKNSDEDQSPIISELQKELNSVCDVCGDVANGTKYGAFACNGCKGFFRRSVKDRRRFCCRYGGDCLVQKDQRNACRACRLKKCLNVGMNPNSVQNERGRKSTKAKERQALLLSQLPCCSNSLQWKNKRSSETQTEIILQNSISPSPKSSLPSLDNDLSIPAVLMLTEKGVMEISDDYLLSVPSSNQKIDTPFEIVYTNPQLVSRRYKINFSAEKILDQDQLINGWRRHLVYFIDWFKRLEDVQQLSLPDQIILAKYRIPYHGWFFHAYNSMICDKTGICYANGAYHPYVGDERYIERDPAMIQFHAKIEDMIFNGLIYPMRKWNMDYCEYLIIKTMSIFRHEISMSAEGAIIVKKAYEKYMRVLFKYIRQKESDLSKAHERMYNFVLLLNTLTAIRMKIKEKLAKTNFANLFEIDSLTQESYKTENDEINVVD
uniref:Uncharacterized protein n=1 Tax=Acrobeloides nanus TaxID=290746 RepID=A0A914C921_9BILA